MSYHYLLFLYVSPFQGSNHCNVLPRALPWAGMYSPFRAKKMPPFLECVRNPTNVRNQCRGEPYVRPRTNNAFVPMYDGRTQGSPLHVFGT